MPTASSRSALEEQPWYSVASWTGAGAQFATTTEYIFNSESLVSTVDQQFASGVATGTAQDRYIHPDHLGSTSVVTDEDGEVVQTLDYYYPYGATRVSTGVDASARKYDWVDLVRPMPMPVGYSVNSELLSRPLPAVARFLAHAMAEGLIQRSPPQARAGSRRRADRTRPPTRPA